MKTVKKSLDVDNSVQQINRYGKHQKVTKVKGILNYIV